MIRGMSVRRARAFVREIDELAARPRGGAVTGVILTAALVPILTAAGGASGALGQSIPLFFLVPVLVASSVGGRGAGVITAVLAVFVWDYFFIPPTYQVTIASTRDALALVVFLLVALLVGQLSTVARRRTDEALSRAHASEAVYEMSMGLIARKTPQDLLAPLLERMRSALSLGICAVLVEDGPGRWQYVASTGPLPEDLDATHSRNVAAVAGETLQLGHECRLGQAGERHIRYDRMRRPRAGSERARFIPLHVGDRPVGVLELVPRSPGVQDVEQEHLLITFANSAAIALEQARLAAEEQAAAVARESDKLKSALLSSVSHDLRTPLAGIKAAASSLLQDDVDWSEDDRHAFIAEIDSSADRLTRLVSNLLDLSRIEAGALHPNKEWEQIPPLVERIVRREMPALGDHPLECSVASGLPPVKLDAVQIEQVLTNLLENAAKYSPPGAQIQLDVRMVERGGQRWLRMTVRDHGPGIDRAEQGRIFDKFYRITGTAARTSGTGMGLAIVKGLVDAHGGTVRVESTVGEGSAFIVELPAQSEADSETAAAQEPVASWRTPVL
jgi:two-component system sensor histidine kinase KdpD